LKTKYADLDIELVASDDVAMMAFFDDVDLIVSVSTGEGFCRPVAQALSYGVPCWLLEDEVFREFYDGYANFSSSVSDLVSKLLVVANDGGELYPRQGSVRLFPPSELYEAFRAAVKSIEAVMRNR
jgi:hypothetical protein